MDASQDLLDWLAAIGQSLVDVKLLSEGVLMQVQGNVLEGIEELRIGDDSLDG